MPKAFKGVTIFLLILILWGSPFQGRTFFYGRLRSSIFQGSVFQGSIFQGSALAFEKHAKEANSRLEYANLPFFQKFNDDILIQYIVCALVNNYNLKSLRARINEVRESKNIEVSKQFPSFSVGANYLGLKIPRVAIPFQGFRDNAFALPFIANWEIDLFGKRKNKIDMAHFDVDSAIYNERGAVIALASEVAGIYFNISNLNSQIEIQKRIIQNKKERLRRVQKSFDRGVLGVQALNNAKKEAEYEEITLNDYKKQRQSFILNLAYLTGEAPDCIKDYEFSRIEDIEFGGKIPDCINSDVTIQRPDVLQKEAALKKAKIDITLARKEFLPNINVFGVLMFSTLTPNFRWDGAVANLLAGATENIFSGGKRIFNLKAKKFAYERLLNEYLEADLAAIKEINDAMYQLKTDIQSYNSNLKNLNFEEDNFVRVSNSYRYGVSNRLDMLDSDNNFLYEKSKVLNSKVQKFADLISLFKAVGGCL